MVCLYIDKVKEKSNVTTARCSNKTEGDVQEGGRDKGRRHTSPPSHQHLHSPTSAGYKRKHDQDDRGTNSPHTDKRANKMTDRPLDKHNHKSEDSNYRTHAARSRDYSDSRRSGDDGRTKHDHSRLHGDNRHDRRSHNTNSKQYDRVENDRHRASYVTERNNEQGKRTDKNSSFNDRDHDRDHRY